MYHRFEVGGIMSHQMVYGATHFALDVSDDTRLKAGWDLSIRPSHRLGPIGNMTLPSNQGENKISELAMIYDFIHSTVGMLDFWRVTTHFLLQEMYGLPRVICSEDMP